MPSELTTPQLWAEELLEVASDSLIATEGGEITRRGRVPGLPAADCCPQLTVHLSGVGLLATNTGPGGLAAGHRRKTGSVKFVRYTITVFRCIPKLGEKGELPTMQAQQDAADIVEQDVWAIVNAVTKADYNGTLFGGRCREFYFDGANSLDPQGGCGGWVIHFRASMEGLAVG